MNYENDPNFRYQLNQFRMVSGALRVHIEATAMQAMMVAGTDIDKAIESLDKDRDDLMSEALLNMSDRVDAEGRCTFCGSEPQEFEDPTELDTCSLLAEEMLITSQAFYRLVFSKMVSERLSTPSYDPMKAANLSAIAQGSGDWQTAVQILEIYPVSEFNEVKFDSLDELLRVLGIEDDEDDDENDWIDPTSEDFPDE